MPARFAEVVDGDDIRMVQPRQGLGFACEPPGELRILLLFPGQDFERDEAVQARLPRLIDNAHATPAEAFENFQLRKQRGDFGRRGRRMNDLGSVRAGCARSLRLSGEAGLQHAFGANPAQCRWRHWLSAMRTITLRCLGGLGGC